MASVTKRGKYWSIRYRVEDELGNVKQLRIGGYLTEEAAWADARRLESASNAGIDVHADKQSVGYVIERWFEEHVLLSVAKTTAVRYRKAADILSKMPIYGMPIRKLSPLSYPKLIEALRNRNPERPISAITACSYADPVRLSLSWAVSQGIIARNPIQGYRLPRGLKTHPADRQTILNENDIADFDRETRNKQIYIPILIGLYGGLRREEAAALEWPRVDFHRGGLHIVSATTCTAEGEIIEKETKTSSSTRFVPMPQFVMDVLRAAPKISSYVCVTAKGERYSLSSYNQAVHRTAERINKRRKAENVPLMPIPTYRDLRHTHAAMLIRMGVQPKVIQVRFGHSSIKVTMDIYGYLMDGLQEEMADRLDGFRAQIHGIKRTGISKTVKRFRVGTKVGTSGCTIGKKSGSI